MLSKSNRTSVFEHSGREPKRAEWSRKAEWSRNREDINELVEGYSINLTIEELLHLQQQQQQDVAEEQKSSEEEHAREDVSSAVVNDMCAKWGELQAFVEKYYPNTVVANRAVNIFNDNVMSHFRKIVQKRKKQLTMDRFLIKEKRKATAHSYSPPKKRERREKTLKESYPALFRSLMLFRYTFY